MGILGENRWEMRNDVERGSELSPRSLAVGSGLNDLGRRGLKPTLRELDAMSITDSTDEFFLKVNSSVIRLVLGGIRDWTDV